MLSVVEHRFDPRVLVVRARLKGDLQSFFGRNTTVDETPDADYRWRTYVSRKKLTNALAKNVEAIDYDNFKDSVVSAPRHNAYMRVWSAMLEAQFAELPRKVRTWASFLPTLLGQTTTHNDALTKVTIDDAEQEVGDTLEILGFRLSRPITEFIKHADA
jgi:hypothetical protein